MIKTLLQLTAAIAILSPTAVLADYGNLWITGAVLNQGKPIQGRLEFTDHDGTTGTVCDAGFTQRAGNVACKQLGYLRAEKVLYKQFGQQSRLPITICETECTGKENRLTQCQLKRCNDTALYQLPCKKENIVGIQCTNLPNPITEVTGNDLDEVGSGVGNVNENGNPIDDEGDDDDKVGNGGDDGNVGNVDGQHGIDPHGTDHHDNPDDHASTASLPKQDAVDGDNDDHDDDDVSDVFFPLTNTESDGQRDRSQGDHSDSDDSVSVGVIIAIVFSCFFVAVVLFVLGIVCLRYKRRRPTFVVTQSYPKILVADDAATTTTTTIPKSYMQSTRITPKGYEALPVTDYVPVQSIIKKPIY